MEKEKLGEEEKEEIQIGALSHVVLIQNALSELLACGCSIADRHSQHINTSHIIRATCSTQLRSETLRYRIFKLTYQVSIEIVRCGRVAWGGRHTVDLRL